MNNVIAKQPLIKLQILGIIAIITFLFVQSTFGCQVDTVTLYTGTTDTEAESMEIESVDICIGGTAYFYAKCTVTNPDELDITWVFDYDNGGTTEDYTTTTTYDSEDLYLEAPADGATSGDYDSIDSKTPSVKCYLIDSSENQVGEAAEDTCDVYVVRVASVGEDKTVACANEEVEFTATPYPSGKSLCCIDEDGWEKRYRANSGANWGDWESTEGGDNTAVLNTDTVGLYQYRARNGAGDTWDAEKESSEVNIISGLTVMPREAYVCINCTKEFAAWACVEGNATDVTSSATFSTSNPSGSMKTTAGSSEGPNNNILHPGSVSISLTSDQVTAKIGSGDPTDADHDCDLTVFDVEMTNPSDSTTFLINHDTMQISPPGITCQVKTLVGAIDVTTEVDLSADWELLLSWTGGGDTYYTPGPTSSGKLTSSDNPYSVLASEFTTGGDLAISVGGSTTGGDYGPLTTSDITIEIDDDPSNSDFSTELGSDIIRAMAWKEWAGGIIMRAANH